MLRFFLEPASVLRVNIFLQLLSPYINIIFTVKKIKFTQGFFSRAASEAPPLWAFQNCRERKCCAELLLFSAILKCPKGRSFAGSAGKKSLRELYFFDSMALAVDLEAIAVDP